MPLPCPRFGTPAQNPPKAGEVYDQQALASNWLAWAPPCPLCGTLFCIARGEYYPDWEIPSGSLSLPQREYPHVSILRGTGVGGIECWKMLVIM